MPFPPRQFIFSILVLTSFSCARDGAKTIVAPWAPPLLARANDPAATIDSIKAHVPALIEAAGVPGLAIAVIAHDELIYSGGFGVSDVTSKAPVRASTVFEGASLGKPVLAVVALRLVESGRLDLDRPIAQAFVDPDFGNDPLYDRVTLRLLLSHSGGLPNLRRGNPLKIYFPPGDHFSYAGTGFSVVQHLIEHVTKEPLDAVASRLVFEPAGMRNTSYVWQNSFEGHSATGYDDNGKPAPKRKPTVAIAPASLQTTAEDYGLFLVALMNGRLMKAATLTEMLKVQIAVSPSCVECLGPVTADRSVTVMWGLGIGLDRTANGDIAWQWGDNDAFKAYLAMSPSHHVGLVYFANGMNGLAIRDDVVGHVLGGDHPDWTFVKYDQYDSPATAAARAILAAFVSSPKAGVAEYEKQKAAGLVSTDETDLDLLGFKVLNKSSPASAVAVWDLEAREFPNSWHPYDSLGLGYRLLNDDARSKVNYRRALELNPNDGNAKKALGIR